ncbi:reducing polyketide synthase DEP5 [Achaetomium macrosporum]|uniref:Reducing polyketide synthase DEP5 n=1 Tax=Achaetomium macrosporum TaxID=79813 RepID=A0AAN7CEJ1_9PEZI|nr:reducing polyketide synthase DEP5 [Achaetomium macrosporum]
MPGLIIGSSSTRSSSRDSYGDSPSRGPGSIYDEIAIDYPATSVPGYAEQPLNKQLEPIAVVGMGCRLPGDVRSPAEFWDMMMKKRSGQTPKVPPNRFNIDAHYHQNNDRPGSFGVLGGYFLSDDLSDFDPGLFGLTPIEAMWMDPQQRKLLEVVYEALESGGIPLDKISGTRTAVFAASFTSDWQQMAFKEHSFRHSLAATGVDPGLISNRISHVFNLNGPSILCNTACSSSMYALHNACNALRNRECDGAIVGGVNLIITVDQHMNTAKLGVLSPTSTCHTFDKSADGYGRADGVGAVYLKRLADAIRDGDPIRGVIRSSATNSNGKVPGAGITHPNREGQVDVITHAYRRGGDLDPLLTGYFECHGTGTAVGDPLEVHAVALAMNKNRRPGEEPLLLGAVKTNIGHSEAASGLSALIKAILVAERGIIPPVRGLVEPNPAIQWDAWQVSAPTEAVPFPAHLPVRRVSINSFGYGGTNAHVIIEGADSLLGHLPRQKYRFRDETNPKPAVPRRAAHRRRPFLLPFSAHDKPTLLRNIEAHAKVAAHYHLLDLSYTLSTRRSVLSSKGFTVASHETLEEAFSNVSSGSFTFADSKKRGPKPPTVGFVFTGQGAQWARMGAELLEYSPRFLGAIRELDAWLEELHDGPDWSIEDVLLEPAERSRVNEAAFSQPVCTAVQVALVQLLESWGIKPVVTVGHSSGEMAAAYAAGLISAREAITLAYYRGVVTRRVTTDGAMLAVGLGAEAVAPYLDGLEGKAVVACHNSPSGVTVSGDADAIEQVKAKLDADGVFARLVKTNGKAYHSHHMAPVSAVYEELVRAAKLYRPFDAPNNNNNNNSNNNTAKAKMVSSVTNSILPPSTVLDESYWSTNLRSPVLFNQAVQTILTADEFRDVDLLIEVGPHSAMAGPVKQIKTAVGREKLEYLPTLLRGADSAVQLLKLAGEMWLRSYPGLDMERAATAYVETGKLAPAPAVIVDLPPYQWNYTRAFWAENRASREHRLRTHARHDLLGERVFGGSAAAPTWRNVLRIRDLPWLKDHTLGGEVVFPAAGYFAMAIEALTQLNELSGSPVGIDNYVLRDVSIQKALVVPDGDDGIEVLLSLHPSVYGSGWWDFGVSSIDGDGSKKEHMAGTVGINAKPRHAPRAVPQFPQRASGKAWNQALREVGFDYGPTFQDMDDIRFDGKRYQASCTTAIKQAVDATLGESRYVLHPATVDSVLQLSIAAIYAGRTAAIDYGVIPIQLDEVAIWPPSEDQVRAGRADAYAWVDKRGVRSFESSAQMLAADGSLVLEIVNLRGVSYEAAVPQKAPSALTERPYGEMRWERDFDSLVEETEAEAGKFTISDLVHLALFKRPDSKVLQVGVAGPDAQDVKDVLSKHPRASYLVAAASEEEVYSVKLALKDHPGAKVVKLDLAQELDAQSLAPASFDLLVVRRQDISDEDSTRLSKTVRPGGYFINAAGAVTAVKKQTPEMANGHAQHSVQLVYRTAQSALVSSVRAALQALGWHVDVTSLKDCSAESGSISGHVIMLADFEQDPLLFTMTQEEFGQIQAIIRSTSSLLWATPGGLLEGKRPEFAMVQGLARTIASEQASLDFRTIDIDLDSVSPEKTVSAIVRAAQHQVAPPDTDSATAAQPDREFCVANGAKTYISRLVRNDSLNNTFSTTRTPEAKAFSAEDRISGKIANKGSVIFQQEPDVEEVAPGHVEVRVLASGLTKEGVLVITGTDYPTTFSHEIGGVVTRTGPGVTTLHPGDRVVGFHADRFASYQQVPASMLHKLEDDDLPAAVSLLTAYASALYGLETLAQLKAGDNVLVLHSTGMSGVAAVQVAQTKRATPYVVVETAAEAAFFESHLGLGAEQILFFSSSSSSSGNKSNTDGDAAAASALLDKLADLTNGHGADVVFSSTGNTASSTAAAREAWRRIASLGRFVDTGRKDVLHRRALDAVPVSQRGASYLSVDLVGLYEARPEVLAGLLPTIVGMWRSQGAVTPGPVQTVHLADLDKAVAGWSDAFGAAKPVITYEPSADAEKMIQVVPARPRLRFSPESTYLLVGCLGGLGRSLTSWMMESGARRFTFLSRSGADSPSAAKLVRDMERAGAVVQVVRGDATSRADVERAVRGVPAEHPIRGVVHAAMVLRDGLFHSMTFSNWKTSVEPKILGAANLHAVLASQPLDFFLMTGSVSGVLGNPTQSNYAAANSYLDSLARHIRRTTQNPAVSVILPMVLGVGVVAENTELEQALKRKGMYGIDEEHLLEAFEAAITASSPNNSGIDHLVVGLDPLGLQKAVRDAAATDSEAFWAEDARFSHVVHDMNFDDSADDEGGSGQGGGKQSILSAIKAAGSPADAVAAVTEHFVGKLARMLLLDAGEFEPDVKSIASYGIDSMIGAELRNWIFKEYKVDVPFQQLLGETLTITKFAGQVCAAHGVVVA